MKLPFWNPAGSIPKKYKNEFEEAHINFIKTRLNVFWMSAIGIYAIARTANLLSNGIPMSLPEVIGASVTACVLFLLWGIAQRSKTYVATRIVAYSYVLIFLALMTVAGIFSRYIALSVVPYIVILFFAALLIPWTKPEVLLLAVIEGIGFTLRYELKFRMVEASDVMKAAWAQTYAEGLVFIFYATILCLIIRHHENSRNVENFLLMKDIEAKGDEIQEKNKQMERDLEFASRIHSTLVPESIRTEVADIAVTYLPMQQVGGDYARFHFADKNKLIFFLSDVTGHGVPAALLVNRTHAELERLVKDGRHPGEIMKSLNNFIVDSFKGTNMYLSAFCGFLDFEEGKLFFSNYGHPPQYLYRTGAKQIEKLESQRSFLGISYDNEVAHEESLSFKPGDRMLLFTDGVIEATNVFKEQFGAERIESFLKENQNLSCLEFNETFLKKISNFHPEEFQDDLFILTIQANKTK